ncbi:metallophosphoesterase family protein [Mariniphaga sp.]|uniref:metallophosphoesterase family protein n=1 Tax=Mariniphaga sp. TaxID=1954475 RepID=UPI003562C075
MKRRKFIQNLGLGVAPVVAQPLMGAAGPEQDFPQYNYRQPETLQETVTKEGQIIVRLEFQSDDRHGQQLKPEINIENGNILRSKSYFFEQGEDNFTGGPEAPVISTALGDVDVLVFWLDRFEEETAIIVIDQAGVFAFSLSEIVKNKEMKGQIGKAQVKANFLLDKEIGELNSADVEIKIPGDDFTFIIMADTQGGDASNPEDNLCRMKIHNAFIEESIRLTSNLKAKPAFCLMLGDIVDHQGEEHHFAQMARFFKRLKIPVLYEMGNHESRYQTSFEPGYNLNGFNNYFAAQKAINGMELLLYSFNLGKWHFVVWPDPLRQMFWENHPHYFDWLERDLEKHKDRPTVFLQHIPMHPIGINPLVNYCETAYVKRLLFDILAKHGNVKTIFSGHVHIPVKSSLKTAVSVRGINCINLPAAGYRPRAFGEEDFYGGPAQGICIVDLKGDKISSTYKTVTLEEFPYPDNLPEFDAEKFPLWFGNKWELPANKQFINGDFTNDLTGWGRRYVYHEDENPSNICEVRKQDGIPALYLKTKKRGFHKPGQDRLPQDINRIFQAVELEQGKNPFIQIEYFLDKKNCDFSGFNGLYIWVEGYRKSARMVNLLYFANKAWVNLGSTYSRSSGSGPLIFSLDNTPEVWHSVRLNIKADFETNQDELKFDLPAPDRLVVSAGIWNINDGREQPFAAFLRNFSVRYNLSSASQVDGKKIATMPDDKKWWRGKLMPSGNVAGEHHYHVEGWNELKY